MPAKRKRLNEKLVRKSAGAGTTIKADNPFEARTNKRLKHGVLGRNVQGRHRNVAAARLQAVTTREKNLRPEYESLYKANSFVDRRFGEGDEGMTDEQKMTARFKRERQMQLSKRKNAFRLGEQEQLTHQGQVSNLALIFRYLLMLAAD